MKNVPRRNRLTQMTPEELKIREGVMMVEALGAHPLLTDCVVLLGQAKDKLSDWVDMPPPVEMEHKSKIRTLLDLCIGNNILKEQAEPALQEYRELMADLERLPDLENEHGT